MSHHGDYSFLDQPVLLNFVFYPRSDSSPLPSGATDHLIFVEEGISISCRFFTHSKASPTILYFHGNGEVAGDYNYIAPYYNRLNINLFVADYRGYGKSNGIPSFTYLIRDAHPILKGLSDFLRDNGYIEDIFVMGRSLGSVPAIELAFHYQDQIKGLIIESGFARVSTLMEHIGIPSEYVNLKGSDVPNLQGIRETHLPLLIIHGEDDDLIPLSEGKTLFEKAVTEKKTLCIIPGANHNDIMLVGESSYFRAIREFIYS